MLELKERLLDEVNKSGVGNATLQKWVDSEEEKTGTAYPKPCSLVDNPYDMESLAMNHPFVDGNKRVAFFVTAAFFQMNGHFIDCDSVVHFCSAPFVNVQRKGPR